MLLDTSGLYCYLDANEWRHAEAVQLMDSAAVRFIHNYVLAEMLALGTARRINRETLLGFVSALTRGTGIQVLWVSQAHHNAAVELLRARPDKTYSLCDAVSFLFMRQAGITQALTTDRHFEQEGMVRLLPR